jgi:ATP-binding cassette subfamily B protein
MSVLSGLVSFVPFIAIFKCVAAMFNKSNDYKEMFTWGIIALVSIVLRFLFQGISLSLSHVGAYDVLYSVRKRLCNHIGKIFLAHQLPDIVSSIVVSVTVLIFLFSVNVPMTLMMIVPIILTFCLQALEMLVAKDVIAEMPAFLWDIGKCMRIRSGNCLNALKTRRRA